MTKKETQDILDVLTKISNPDAHVNMAKAICEKQLAYFDSMRGQLKDGAEYFYWGDR